MKKEKLLYWQSKPLFWTTRRFAQIAEIIIYIMACGLVVCIGWVLK